MFHRSATASYFIMLPGKSEALQSHKAHRAINNLATELVERIIRGYAIVSVNEQPSSPMNFLLVCPLWRVVGQSCQHLFTPHLVVNGHDEVEQLLTLHKCRMIHPSIKSLTVNFSPTYAGEPLDECIKLVAAMGQIQQDLERLRLIFLGDWVVPSDKTDFTYLWHPSERSGARLAVSRDKKDRPHWHSLNLEHFSLAVDLSAISAQRLLLKGWTRHWGSKLGKQWRSMGWKGSEGFHGDCFYSYWDIDSAWLSPR